MRITPEEFALRVNSLRNEVVLKYSYTQEEISELFKLKGLPYSVSYFCTYVKYGIIVRIARGEYRFTENPVYKGVIEQALTSIRKYNSDSVKKASGKLEQEELERKINTSIRFLKENGYLVFKPM